MGACHQYANTIQPMMGGSYKMGLRVLGVYLRRSFRFNQYQLANSYQLGSRLPHIIIAAFLCRVCNPLQLSYTGARLINSRCIAAPRCCMSP